MNAPYIYLGIARELHGRFGYLVLTKKKIEMIGNRIRLGFKKRDIPWHKKGHTQLYAL